MCGERSNLPFMCRDPQPINLNNLDHVLAHALSGMGVEELGVGVTLPDSTLLPSLFPLCSAHFDGLRKAILTLALHLNFLRRQITMLLQEIKKHNYEFAVGDKWRWRPYTPSPNLSCCSSGLETTSQASSSVRVGWIVMPNRLG